MAITKLSYARPVVYIVNENAQSVTWEDNFVADEYVLATNEPLPNMPKIKYFNCKRCGAVGQKNVCEYCGSAE